MTVEGHRSSVCDYLSSKKKKMFGERHVSPVSVGQGSGPGHALTVSGNEKGERCQDQETPQPLEERRRVLGDDHLGQVVGDD